MQRSGRNGISTTAAAIIIVILIIAVVAGVYFITNNSSSTSTTTTSSSTTSSSILTTSSTTSLTTSATSSSSSTGAIPTTFTYEAAETPEYLDPGISYFSYDYNVMQNVYEPLLWYNASCSTCVIPWLAQGYTVSSDQKTYSFTLRSGITFADGEPLNSSAVYFSLNRLLIFDGSTPFGHATQASWLLQQLLNTSLSTTLSGAGQSYGPSYVKAVLAENFVTITGPLTFNINVMNPSSAVPELLAGQWATIIAPNYVMQKDVAMWSSASAGYSLPNAQLTGTTLNKITQYLQDLSSTCNAGSTSGGCGATYLNTSIQGSQAGTGPYTLASNQVTSNTITLSARAGYWGGPYSTPIAAKIPTVVFKFVPDVTTREIDLQNAAKSGQAMSIDLLGTNLYDIADRNAWLNTNTLKSDIAGVSLYGTFPFYGLTFDPFDTNVSNALSGQYYKFQPFADLRLRTAFADSVNMTEVNVAVNNKVGTVAINVVPPGLPPTGSFNSAITPAYSFNPDQVQALLLSAMEKPLTSFTFVNGTAAPAGFFNNAFGCTSLGSNGQCSNPVPQTIPLVAPSGDTFDTAVFTQVAETINNVSATYNMGLTVTIVPVPTGQLLANAFSVPTHYYMYALGWIDDYPWVLDFLTPMFAPNGAYTGADGWNLGQMATLNSQAIAASQSGNIAGIVAASNAMNTLGNSEVMYLWTLYSVNFVTMTSNVQGFYFNPSLSTAAASGVGPEYFATLY